jgi:tRNA/tmRNA/rRNA uracil-C5-methylase (TrmA/RlmC/RlmD family)
MPEKNIISNSNEIITTIISDLINNLELDNKILINTNLDENTNLDQNIIDDYNEYDNQYLEYENENKNILIDEDAWEDSINDNKFYINNKIARIFPIIKNFNNYSKLMIDEDSFSYITVREIADMITKLISYHLLYFNLNPQKMKIIDYTAGVGGNVLSFSKYFNYVYGVEIDELRASYLDNNINVYGFKNVEVINDCSINFNYNEMIKINPNVIFMDPPWGGNDYKNSDTLLLKLGDKSIEELVGDIIKIFSEYYLNENNNKYINLNNKLIVLKLPKNYDIEYFYNYIKDIKVTNYLINTYLYILNKMIIIICEMNYQ